MSLRTPYEFTLDIVDITKIPYMKFYQTDVNTAQMDISITNNGEAVDLTGHTIILNIKKADGTEVQNLSTIADATKGLVNVSLSIQSLTAIGECIVQLTIFQGETRKSIHEFKYYVEASLLNTEVPLSSNEYGLLLQLINEVQEVENILNTSEAERVEAENNRVVLFGQLNTLKAELETLQGQLNSLETNVENEEATRILNEEDRKTLKVQLNTLKAELELFATNLSNLDYTVSTNETTRQTQEETRQTNEVARQDLKGQLQSLKGALEGLESTLTTNDTNRTNLVNTKLYDVDNSVTSMQNQVNTTLNGKVTEVNTKISEVQASKVDIENRFALLQTSQQQASEVINARTSTIKAKTFASLGARIEETEQNILTSQATSVVDSVIPFNVLTNSLDGATDVSVKGMSLVQLVKNGNFANGASGWSGTVGTLSVANNTLSVTGNGTIATPILTSYLTNIPSAVGKKVFIKCKVRVTNAVCTEIDVVTDGSVAGTNQTHLIANPVQNQWYNVSVIHTQPTDVSGNIQFKIYCAYQDATTANGKIMEIQEVMALDLTALGLDTKTADEINAMLPSYFEGIASVEGGVIKSVGENLFDGKLELGYWDITTGLKGTSGAIRCNSHIRIKGSTQYNISGITGVDTTWVVFYDTNKVRISSGSTKTFTTPSNAYYMTFYTTGASLTDNVMLVVGSVAKPYTQYKESKILLSDYIEAQYFPLRSVSPTVSDEAIGNKLYKRLNKVVLNGSETGWILSDSSLTNTIRFQITLPIQNKLNALGLGFLCNIFNVTSNAYSFDVEGVQMSSSTQGVFYVRISKTKVTDLATFKTWLASNNIEVIYELNTPTEITLDRKINMPIFKNGSIIQEPSKMFAKLSYSFPTNIGRSVESIVNNLAWIKDNQQFIMSYLLELDTRLTLGGH